MPCLIRIYLIFCIYLRWLMIITRIFCTSLRVDSSEAFTMLSMNICQWVHAVDGTLQPTAYNIILFRVKCKTVTQSFPLKYMTKEIHRLVEISSEMCTTLQKVCNFGVHVFTAWDMHWKKVGRLENMRTEECKNHEAERSIKRAEKEISRHKRVLTKT